MEVVRLADAKPYFPPKHADVRCLRLQGFEASGAASFSVGLSHFLPGGGAELDATPVEKVYVVVSGEVTVTTRPARSRCARWTPAGWRRASRGRSPTPPTCQRRCW